MAEWLWRQIRNLFRFPSAGSNPAGVVIFLHSLTTFLVKILELVLPGGVETYIPQASYCPVLYFLCVVLWRNMSISSHSLRLWYTTRIQQMYNIVSTVMPVVKYGAPQTLIFRSIRVRTVLAITEFHWESTVT